MCGVAWCNFSWEAFASLFAGFATLIAGALAVGAAIYVGRLQYRIMLRQHGILKRQHKILGHQTTIEHLKLRSEKFDLRWQVYEDTVNWLRDWFASGDRPSDELSNKFIWSIEKSKFLFRPEVTSKLQEWHTASLKLRMLNRKLARDLTDAQYAEFGKMQEELAAVLESAFRTVGDLFAEDMRLSESQTTLPPLNKLVQTDEAQENTT